MGVSVKRSTIQPSSLSEMTDASLVLSSLAFPPLRVFPRLHVGRTGLVLTEKTGSISEGAKSPIYGISGRALKMRGS